MVDGTPVPPPDPRAIAEELLRAEKQRWAYEIHDGLTQTVAAAILQLEVLSQRISSDPEGAATDLSDAAVEMRACMADIRSILFGLSTGADDEGTAPSDRIGRCVDDVADRWGLHANLAIEGDLLDAPPQALAVGQVVIHEALTNAAKHAPESGAEVLVTATGKEMVVSVSDHGDGIGDNRARFGMRMMERRVRDAGGSLEVESAGNGTRVTAHFPMGA